MKKNKNKKLNNRKRRDFDSIIWMRIKRRLKQRNSRNNKQQIKNNKYKNNSKIKKDFKSNKKNLKGFKKTKNIFNSKEKKSY